MRLAVVLSACREDVCLRFQPNQRAELLPGLRFLEIFEGDRLQKPLSFPSRLVNRHALSDDERPQAHECVDSRIHGFEVAVPDFANHTPVTYFSTTAVVRTEDFTESLSLK